MLDQKKQKKVDEEIYSTMYPGINIPDFLKKPDRKDLKIAASVNIPDVEDKATTVPPVGSTPPVVGGAPPLPGASPPLPGTPPLPGGPPLSGALPLPGVPPPLGGPMGIIPPQGMTEEKKEDLLDDIDDFKDVLDDVSTKVQFANMKQQILEEVKNYYSEMEKELNNLKNRKIPERKFFDTEGTYKDTLYGMATRMLDEFLPDLFEEVPDYAFLANQVSRLFDDGTVADALISMVVTVPKNDMKYEFKVQIPILNGLMQYPLYIQRGQKIIPLTKSEIQEELMTLSYRRVDPDITQSKGNIFDNNGKNIYRRPDHQKWMDVIPNINQNIGMPPITKYSPQRGHTK